MKKICYLLLILSYLMVGFILIFYNIINPHYNNLLGIIMTIIVVIIWIVIPIVLVKYKKKELAEKYNDKLENWLMATALLPVIIVLSPLVIIFLIMVLIDMINNRFYKKCKSLRKKGFKYKQEKKGKNRIYLLSKENNIFMFTSDYVYSVSIDGGQTFTNMIDSSFFNYEERTLIKERIIKFNGCDYRDRDIYEPTDFIIEIIDRYY